MKVVLVRLRELRKTVDLKEGATARDVAPPGFTSLDQLDVYVNGQLTNFDAILKEGDRITILVKLR